jgi:hypothetical protein
MGRVELKHYPASKLPVDLRGEFGVNASVNIVIEEDKPHVKPLIGEELKQMINSAQQNTKGITTEEAVARIRVLRDEWDD